MALVACAWLVLLAVATVGGREISAFSMFYNLPITLAFGALALDLAVRGAGPRRHARTAYASLLLIWAVGGALLTQPANCRRARPLIRQRRAYPGWPQSKGHGARFESQVV
jgi:hypothetical protein